MINGRTGLALATTGILLLSGCGSTSGGSSGGGGVLSSDNGEASKNADQVFQDAVNALKAAKSVHMKGTFSAPTSSASPDGASPSAAADSPSNIDARFGNNGQTLDGTITYKGAVLKIRSVNGKGYLQAPGSFWKSSFGDSGTGATTGATIANCLGDKWVSYGNSGSSGLGTFGGLDASKALQDFKGTDGKLSKGDAKVIGDQPAIEIRSATAAGDRKGSIWVATTGTAYPVRLEQITGTSPGAVDFSEFDQSLNVTAPKDAIDFTNPQTALATCGVNPGGDTGSGSASPSADGSTDTSSPTP